MPDTIETLKAKVRDCRGRLEEADAIKDAARLAYHEAVAELQQAQRNLAVVLRPHCGGEPIDRMAELRTDSERAIRSYETRGLP